MISTELLAANILSPMVLAFALGVIACLIKSDLKLPEGLYTALSIYLLFAIGLKGGAALSEANPADLWKPAVLTLFLGVLTAFGSFVVAKKFGKLSRIDAASMAAHYGSVSAVTFIAATSFAELQSMKTEGFLSALVVVLEIPAILIGIYLAKQAGGDKKSTLHELLTGKTVLLLVGGMLIGLVCGHKGVDQVKPLFGDLFKGALTIFLLDMGILAASRLPDLKQKAGFLAAFGIVMPLVHGVLGAMLGRLVGLSVGGAGILGAMAASASYIAAPAAVKIALPKANVSMSLAASLAITFPFNLLIGIPLYQAAAGLI